MALERYPRPSPSATRRVAGETDATPRACHPRAPTGSAPVAPGPCSRKCRGAPRTAARLPHKPICELLERLSRLPIVSDVIFIPATLVPGGVPEARDLLEHRYPHRTKAAPPSLRRLTGPTAGLPRSAYIPVDGVSAPVTLHHQKPGPRGIQLNAHQARDLLGARVMRQQL